jgi:hypothetical protein
VDELHLDFPFAGNRMLVDPFERSKAILLGFSGILQVGGYAGYREVGRRNDVTLAFCWAHVRRKFFELAKAEASPTATPARIDELMPWAYPSKSS